MENTTIVPNRDGIWGPLETTLKIHPLCVSEQEIKQSFAFVLRQFVNLLGKFAVYNNVGRPDGRCSRING